MTGKLAKRATGRFSEPHKMPGYAYGLPAITTCKIGSKLRPIEGSVCSFCYAMRGRYNFKETKDAAMLRLTLLVNDLEWWAAAMRYRIERFHVQNRYFRWHDSGDVTSISHVHAIDWIARHTPKVLHWLPTHDFATVQTAYTSREVPPNLSIRVSSPRVGQPPIHTRFRTCTVGYTPADPVNAKTWQCPAANYDHTCGPCRACWLSNENVNYPLRRR